MKILAIETSTVAGSVAVIDKTEGLIGEIRVDVRVAHSERLMPSIKWLLDSSGLTVGEIDAFAVSIGPGSFTGLRIGLSTAKGLAYASKKPLIPVRTLDAFARTLPFCSYLICPVLDARKNEVYAALYRWDETGCVKIMEEEALTPEELFIRIKEPVLFMGEGVKRYEQLIKESVPDSIIAPPSRMSPSAASVGEVAM
ncbi:tRNA (adenosine(37)-N6)-threonylcarbamoyltransferase complex dimerization subunit type 1 TsaB, partial [bacterium]|nr:tRNA (adenosine(37)-N6)-threonylcarbamoyltransferase complex dimerization subunit type 1 TsaB [bacterium]